MASVRKRPNGKYQAQVRVRGHAITKTFTFKVAAQQWATEKELEFLSHAENQTVPGKNMRQVLERFITEELPRRTRSSQRWEGMRLRVFLRSSLADVSLANLSPQVIQRYIHHRMNVDGVASSTVNRELNLLSFIFTTSIKKWNWMRENPCSKITRPKNPPHRVARISDAEAAMIVDALGYADDTSVETSRQELAVAFLLAIETAMRRGEIWSLFWEEVNLAERFVHLPRTKNGSPRDVPLTARAVDLLQKLSPQASGAVFRSNMDSCTQYFRRALQAVGLNHLRFHDARHEATTRLAKKLPMHTLMKVTGHKDARYLAVYYNPTASEIAQMLD